MNIKLQNDLNDFKENKNTILSILDFRIVVNNNIQKTPIIFIINNQVISQQIIKYFEEIDALIISTNFTVTFIKITN